MNLGSVVRAIGFSFVLSVAVGAVACNPLEDGPGPLPTPTVRPTATPNRAYATVRVGTIVDAVKTLGRVVAAQESDLSFRNTGRIRDVYVQPGNLVTAGQVLAELDQRDLPWQLARAELAVGQAEVRLEAAQARVIVDTREVDQFAIQTVRVQIDGAINAISRLDDDISDADLRDAEARVATAKAAVDSARFAIAVRDADIAAKQAELALRELPPTVFDIQRAELDVETAKVRLSQAKAGPLREDLRAAEIVIDQEKTKLARLLDAAPVRPEDLAGAEIEVRRAQAILDRIVADIDAGGKYATQSARDNALEAGRNAVASARVTFEKLRATRPTDGDIAAQRASLRVAEIALERLRAPTTYDAEAVQAGLRAAEARVVQVRVGNLEAERSALRAQLDALRLTRASAEGAVTVGLAGVDAATTRLAFVRRGPDEFDRQEARNRLAGHQSQLAALQDRAETNQQTVEQTRTVASFDEETLRRAVVQARLDVSNFQDQTGDVRITSPLAGRVTRIAARPGDTVQAFFPIMNVSSLEGVVVKADISEAELPRLGVGMPVELTMDIYPNQTLRGTISRLPVITTERVGAAPDRATRITVDWPPASPLGRPELGMLARVQITLLRKPDVILIPNASVKVVGKRKFVEYMDGPIRRSRNVELGIATEIETEVLSGLQPGMIIIAGQN